jgi:hypothetical protein
VGRKRQLVDMGPGDRPFRFFVRRDGEWVELAAFLSGEDVWMGARISGWEGLIHHGRAGFPGGVGVSLSLDRALLLRGQPGAGRSDTVCSNFFQCAAEVHCANLHPAGSRGRALVAKPATAGTALAAERASAVAKQLLAAGAALALQHCYWCWASLVGAHPYKADSKRWCSQCYHHRRQHGQLYVEALWGERPAAVAAAGAEGCGLQGCSGCKAVHRDCKRKPAPSRFADSKQAKAMANASANKNKK